jgi:hypothetical protein
MSYRLSFPLLAALLVASSGCVSMRDSTPIHDEVAERGIQIVRSLPKTLPSKTSVVPNAQYVIINADSGIVALADFVNPIPFVGDLVVDQWNQNKANQFKQHIFQIDPYVIASERLADSPILSSRENALQLMPFVYMMECDDARFRLTLVFRVESEAWMGRYLYHLPTTYTVAEMKSDSPLAMSTLRDELVLGCDKLRGLLERDARNDWPKAPNQATIGSYYLVGASTLGLIPASASLDKHVEILDEGADEVVIRSGGNLLAPGNAGALNFGVHYFRKDQLHTFEKK